MILIERFTCKYVHYCNLAPATCAHWARKRPATLCASDGLLASEAELATHSTVEDLVQLGPVKVRATLEAQKTLQSKKTQGSQHRRRKQGATVGEGDGCQLGQESSR